MKGGSVASSSVGELVQTPTWEKLDAQFDNQVGGKKKSKKQSTKTAKTNKSDSKKTKQEQSQSKKGKQQGGFCPVCGGGMKHINDFDDEGMFNLYNKKGGASPMFQMKYDYTDAMMKPLHGEVIQRGLNTDLVSAMATDSPSSLGSMNKTVEFGNVFDAPKVPFTYSGGAKKKPASKPKKQSTKAPKKAAVKKSSK